MNSKVNDKTRNKIEYLVLKNFITVLKHKKLYTLFRGVVGYRSGNPITCFYARMPGFPNVFGIVSSKNPFIDVNDITSMVNVMEFSVPNEMNAPGEDKTMKTQLRIANCVNILIHVFIEKYICDLKVLEDIGGSVFEMTCRELLGNDFKDVLPPPPSMPEGVDASDMYSIPWDDISFQRVPINHDSSNNDEFWRLIFNENE